MDKAELAAKLMQASDLAKQGHVTPAGDGGVIAAAWYASHEPTQTHMLYTIAWLLDEIQSPSGATSKHARKVAEAILLDRKDREAVPDMSIDATPDELGLAVKKCPTCKRDIISVCLHCMGE